mgnify:CR=1 FL=1
MYYDITVVRQWKKREVIQNKKELREKMPSFLNYIGGEKNGRPVVVVFIKNNEKEKAKRYFTNNSVIPKAEYEVVNVNSEVKNISEYLEEPKLSAYERKLLQDIIRNEEEKLLAFHSNLIGIGVGCKTMRHGLQENCIVLHCLDKTLIPFGEEELPEFLGGYPVDLRDDFFMIGHNTRSHPLKWSSREYAGSVEFHVKSNKPSNLSECGFLAPEHVAKAFAELHKEEALLTNPPFPGIAHKIDFSSDVENETKTRYSEAKSVGLNTACVLVSKLIGN